ncbi:MAG: cyclic pyranopterin monophosphate synthase MoaC [Myxococcota bacterium]
MKVYLFENIDETLPLLPLAARRALDAAGLHVGLAAWRSMSLEARRAVVEAGSGEACDIEAASAAVAGVTPAPEVIERDDFRRLQASPDATLTDAWAGLGGLARFALAHLVSRGDRDRLAQAVTEICGESEPAGSIPLTHLDASGAARMVDVGVKAPTHRTAVARAGLRMRPDTAALVRDHSGPKGDVIATARIAGIMAAKRTDALIPLCHGVALTSVAVDITVDVEAGRVTVTARAEAHDRTGVEMEAMVGASVAALTVYDMLKAVERELVVERVMLLEKTGGRRGDYRREPS